MIVDGTPCCSINQPPITNPIGKPYTANIRMPITRPRISNLVKVISTTDIEIMQKLIDAPINARSGKPMAFESV